MRRLFTKDLREQLKTYRILIAVIAFALFGLVSPLTMKMLPHMIPVSGTGGFQLTMYPGKPASAMQLPST